MTQLDSIPLQLVLTGLLCSFLQQFRHVINTPAKRLAFLFGAKSDRNQEKFAHQLVNFTFHVIACVSIGSVVVSEGWLQNTEQFFTTPNFTQHKEGSGLWHSILYCCSFGYHLQRLASLLNKSHRHQSDFFEMAVHHTVTVVLLFSGLTAGFVRVGLLILLLHNASDVLGCLVKLVNACDMKVASAFIFVPTVAVWAYLRCYILPFKIIPLVSRIAIEDLPRPTKWSSLVGLIILVMLHCYWFLLFMKMLYLAISTKGGKVVDLQDSVVDEEDKDKTAATKAKDKTLQQQQQQMPMLVIIGDRQYDVSKFNHPGGKVLLSYFENRDATEPFEAYHAKTPRLERILKSMDAGPAPNKPKSAADVALEKDWRSLKDQVEKEGLYNPSFLHHGKQCVIVAVLYYLAYYFWLSHPFIGAMFLGFAFQNAAFLGHDTGHLSVFTSVRWSGWYGLFIGNFLSGIGICWWKESHNNHHAVPNCYDYDQDVQHAPFVGHTAKPIYSDFYRRQLPGIPWIRFQHLYFYPLMFVARFNLYIQSTLHALKWYPHGHATYTFHKQWELITIAGFWLWYSYALSFHDGNTIMKSLMITHIVAGILHVQILLSHYGEPLYSKHTRESDLRYYIRSQLDSSINISSPNFITDVFHGGLNRQIDHHLFPRIPRHNLPRLSELVKVFCDKHNLPHRTMGFVEANIRLVRTLSKAHLTNELMNAIG
eukprot:PhF_6_TR13386/c0_g1_i1/m.21256